jgi:copper chaperone CopZ
MAALGKVHEVYGIRQVEINEQQRTVRVEFDFTRLNRAVVEQLLRRTGLDIADEISLIPPQPLAEPAGVPPASTK